MPTTPQYGAGATPAGSSPAGSGMPATNSYVRGRLFPDEVTGNSQTGRLIDIASGQYVIATTGLAIGMGTVAQIVQLALFDIDFSSIDTIADDTPTRVANLVTTALASAVNQNLVQILSINAQQFGANGEAATLRWRDLTTSTDHTTPIGS